MPKRGSGVFQRKLQMYGAHHFGEEVRDDEGGIDPSLVLAKLFGEEGATISGIAKKFGVSGASVSLLIDQWQIPRKDRDGRGKFMAAIIAAGYTDAPRFFLDHQGLTFEQMGRVLGGVTAKTISRHYGDALREIVQRPGPGRKRKRKQAA